MPVQLTCQNCGKEFQVKAHRAEHAKYCSRDCRWAGHPRAHIACKQCGKTFSVMSHRASTAQFCSTACQSRGLSEMFKGPRIEKRCGRCGTIFHVKPHQDSTAKYCGRKCSVSAASLTPSASPNARRFQDLTGRRYGRLLVLGRAENIVKECGTTAATFLCRCDCGKESVVRAACLTHGRTRSCGCLRDEKTSARMKVLQEPNRLPYGEAHRNSLMDSCTRAARKRGISFDLTREQFVALIARDCYYCGIPASDDAPDKHPFHGRVPYNGIDRLDSSDGYNSANCVPCCKRCNYAKNKMTENEFYEWIRRAYSHIKSRQPKLL